MVGFRNNVGSAQLTGWVSSSSQQIAFSRGSLGFVAINNADTEWSETFSTGLPSGSYCNVFEGAPNMGTCNGEAFRIAYDGSLTVTVGPRQAIAMHTGARARGLSLPKQKTPQQVTILFSETANTTFGENIFVVGSVPQLGNWDPSNAIPLDPTDYPVWGATVYLTPSAKFEYKFIRKESNGDVVWESDPVREGKAPASGLQSIEASWR